MATQQDDNKKQDATIKVALITGGATVMAAVIVASGAFATGIIQLRTSKPEPTPSSLSNNTNPGQLKPVPQETSVTTKNSPEVSTKATDLFLTEMQPVESDGEWSTGDYGLNAKSYKQSIAIRSCYDDAFIGYNLNRTKKRFKATIGPSDLTRSGLFVRFRVTLDGRQLVKYDLRIGQTRELDLNISEGMRLSLHAELKDSESTTDCSKEGEGAIWGNASVS